MKSETDDLWNFRTLAFSQVQFGHAGAQAAALREHSCTPRENIKCLELLGQRQGRNSNGQERCHEGTPWRPPRNKKNQSVTGCQEAGIIAPDSFDKLPEALDNLCPAPGLIGLIGLIGLLGLFHSSETFNLYCKKEIYKRTESRY